VELLDGGQIRTNLSNELGFSKEDREANVRRIGFICHLLSRNGVIAIASAISPYRAIRDENQRQIGSFVEVFIKSPLETCMERDVKGLYKKALAGEIRDYTGVSDPYEEPLNHEILVETDKESSEESLSMILRKLEDMKYLPSKTPEAEESMPEEEIYSIEEEEQIKKRLQDLGYI